MIKWDQGQLCSYCKKQVEEKEVVFHRRLHEGVPHYYLFEWNEDSDHFCKRAAYFLKNKGPGYFKEWLSYFGSEVENKAISAILAPKSASEQRVNHAQSLSVSLQKLFPYSCVIEVEVGGEGQQKRKTRKERLAKSSSSGFGNHLLDSQWVFADDVFVTGGTYERVKAQVGSEPECIVTLFYRSLWEKEDD